MKTKKSRTLLLLLLVVVAVFCSACSGSGCNIDTTLNINSDLSGTRTMVVSIDADDFNSYFNGTVSDCKSLIEDNCPSELSYTFTEDASESATTYPSSVSTTVADTEWWSDDYQTSENTQIVGDGTWTYVVATAAYSGTLDGEDFTVPPNFNVEIVDTETASTYYITSNTLGSIWTAGDCIYDNMTGDTGGSVTWSTQTADIWTITVIRTGQDFSFVYYLNDTKVISQTITGTNMPEDASCHLISGAGLATYAVTTDGSVPTIDAYAEDWYGLYDADGVAVFGQPVDTSIALEVTFTLSFSSVADYTKKVAGIIGEEPEIDISIQDSIWAAGVYVDESFDSEDLLQWFSDALIADGYVDSSKESYILDCGDTNVIYNNGDPISSSDSINVNDMVYLSISSIDVLTDINAFDDYDRTVIFHIPSSSMDQKGDEITAYMESIVPPNASYESSTVTDGTDFTYTASGLTAAELGTFNAALFGDGNTVTTENVDKYYSPFVFSQYMTETVSLSNFLAGDLSVNCYYYVNVSDTYNICVTSDPTSSYDAASNYYADEDYDGYYYVDSLKCYSNETYEVPMLFQKTFTVSSIDVSSKHSAFGNSWTRSSVFSFVDTPSEDEESVIIARLEALAGVEDDSVESSESESINEDDSTEEEPSVGKVTIKSDTEDDVYQITIKQSGDAEEMLYSSELLFGSAGTLSYASESGLTKFTKTEAFTEYINYSNILADVTSDFVINYSMKVGMSPKMTYSETNGESVYDEAADKYVYGSVSNGCFTYTTDSKTVNVLYTGTSLDIFTILFWLALVAAIALIVIGVLTSGIIPKKAARIPQQPMQGAYMPQQPMQNTYTSQQAGYQQPMQGSYQQPVENNYQQPGQPVQNSYQQPVQDAGNTQQAATALPPKFCPSCGATLAPGSVFCESCGYKVQ